MATVAELQVEIGADIKRLEKGISRAQRKLQDAGRSMQRVGRSLTQAVSVPLALAGAGAVKAASDFESSFADIRKTVEASESQFSDLQGEIRAMSKEIPTSVNELNRLGGVAGQLGVEAENIADFTKTIAMLGDTTDVAGEQAALSISRFMNVMGTAQSDIDRLGSTIVGLGNNFAAMESEIIEIGTALAPLGNTIGLSEQQVLSFSATIASSGGKARAAATAFQRAANTMKESVITGDENLQTFAQTAGMTANEFRQAFQEDAGGALVSFMEGLRKVQQEGGSVSTVLGKVGLSSQELIREFGKVLGNLDDLNEAIPMANQAWERNTALTDEAQKRYSTFASRVKILWNRIKDVGITIGNLMIPTINKLIDVSKNVISSFNSLSDETKRMGVIIAGVLGASGPILVALGTLTAALGAISWPVVLGVTAVAGAVGAIIANWDKVVAYFTTGQGDEMWSTVKEAGQSLFTSLKELFHSATSTLKRIWDLFGDEIVGLTEASFTLIKGALQTGFDALALALDVFTGRWATDWDGFWSDNENRVRRFAENAESIVTDFLGAVDDKNVDTLIEPINLNELFGGQDAASDVPMIFRRTQSSMGAMFDTWSSNVAPFKTQTQQMIDDVKRLRQFLNTDLSFEKSGTSMTFSTNIDEVGATVESASKGMEGVLTTSFDSMKASGAKFATATEAALSGLPTAFDKFVAKSKKAGFDFVSFLTNQVTSAVATFSESIGKMVVGAGPEFASGLQQILLIVVDFAKQLAQLLIGIGSAIAFVPGLQGNAAAFIAGGAALMAVASGVGAAIQKNIDKKRQQAQEAPQMAQGGLAFGPTLAVVGDNANARSNPEVIAPLDKLQGMMSQSGGTTRVEGVIRGSDIHLANERGKNKFR